MVFRHGLWEATDLSRESERDDIVLYVAVVVWKEVLRGAGVGATVAFRQMPEHSTNLNKRVLATSGEPCTNLNLNV